MPLSSYLTRLIWLCVAPLVAFSAWLVYDHVRILQADNAQEAGYIAQNFATAIDHHLNARSGALALLSATPLARQPSRWTELYHAAQEFRQRFGSHIILSDGENMLFHTRAPLGTPLPPLPKSGGETAATRAIATGRPAVGDIVFGPIAQEPLVAIAVPVPQEGQSRLLLLAIFETRLFQERLEQIALPADWNLALLDSQGRIIARRRPPEAAQPYKSIVIDLSAAPWKVVLEIPRAGYVTPLATAATALALGILAALLIGIGGGLWGTRRLSAAVAGLTRPITATDGDIGIREISEAHRRIEDASQRIASFAASQDRAIEQERRRVAREVHDQMGQVFTAIKLIIQSIPRAAFPPGQEAALMQALEMGVASARKITAALRPPLLDDLGLAAALEHFGRETARTAGVDCGIEVRDTERLCADQALGLFRIVQEAMTNSLRHACATRIRIDGQADADHYHLRIEDNGQGFDAAAVRPDAMGLTNMQERARLMNGTCRIGRCQEGGTCVAVSLPLDKPCPGAKP